MLLKDDLEHPIPVELRSRLSALVDAFCSGNYAPNQEGVAPIDDELARLIAENIKAYGDELTPLNNEVWARSVYRWMDDWWDLLLDLTTLNDPVSDLALHIKVLNAPDYLFVVRGVWVP
jgi:hypothetical protein